MTSAAGTSGPPITDDEQLARYLLGELSPDEAAAIDDALVDDALWDAARRAEDELLDAYVADRLDATRRQRLAERIAASPRLRDRVELHRDLRAIAARRRRRPRRAVAALAGGVAVAAVLIVVLVARGGTQRATTSGGDVVALVLAPTTRAGEVAVVQVSGHDAIAVSAVMDAEEAFPRYRLELTSLGVTRWRQDNLVAAGGMLTLRLPVAVLADGVYQLEITGLGAGGAPVRLGVRGFRVER